MFIISVDYYTFPKILNILHIVYHGLNIMRFILLTAIFSFALSGCNIISSDKKEKRQSGEIESADSMKITLVKTVKDGKTVSTAHVRNGIRHGEACNYYSNGRIASRFYYNNGVIQGKAYKYYMSGKVYRIRNYINGKVDGTVIKLYESGDTLSTQNYIMGMPSNDLKEFDEDGKLITKGYPKLVFYIKSSPDFYKREILEVTLSNKSSRVKYYINPDNIKNVLSNEAILLPQNGPTGLLQLQPEDRGKEFNIVAKYITPYRNACLIERTFKY